jgi:hypothetical protein
LVIAIFILGLVQGQYLVSCFVQAIRFVAQLFMGAAALFADVTGELDAVNSKHVPTDESLCITGH